MTPETRVAEAEKQLAIASENFKDTDRGRIAGQLAGLVAMYRDSYEEDPQHFHDAYGDDSSASAEGDGV